MTRSKSPPSRSQPLSPYIQAVESPDSSPVPRARRTGLACAECRRSKLKCDRAIPCQSCCRRGCASICPNGAMVATKGNKALQNRAQHLAEQVAAMTARIKELETALSASRSQSQSPKASPLDITFDNAYPRSKAEGDCHGTLGIDNEGLARFFGESSASEHLLQFLPGPTAQSTHYSPKPQELGLSGDIAHLYDTFPFGLRENTYPKDIFVPYLPPRERALGAVNCCLQSFGWFIVSRQDVVSTIIDPIYGYNQPNVESLHPHRLSLLFGILSLASLRSTDDDVLADMNAARYYVLACSSFSLAPILSEASCVTIQALFTCNTYLYTRVREASEENWLLLGIMSRLGYRIGLRKNFIDGGIFSLNRLVDRDGSQFELDDAEVLRRRITFWELYTWDAWMSLTTGRPSTMSLADADTEIPEEGIDDFHTWRYRFAAECLWPTLRTMQCSNVSYDAAMQLDHRVRAFHVPPQLQKYNPETESRLWSNNITDAMREYLVTALKELTLFFLHRNYFAIALTDETVDPLDHKYRSSILATYHGAGRLSVSLRDLYHIHPTALRKIWFFWSAMFSACVILASIPILRPGCELSRTALAELKAACSVFADGAQDYGYPGASFVLQKLRRRAEWSMESYWADPLHHRRPQQCPGDVDELCVLGGLQNVIQYPSFRSSQTPSPPLSQMSGVVTPLTRADFHFVHHRVDHAQRSWQQLQHDGLPSSSTIPIPHRRTQEPFEFVAHAAAAHPMSYMSTYADTMTVTDLPPVQPLQFTYSSHETSHQAGGGIPRIVVGGHVYPQASQFDGASIIDGGGSSHGLWKTFVGGLVDHQSAVQSLDQWTV